MHCSTAIPIIVMIVHIDRLVIGRLVQEGLTLPSFPFRYFRSTQWTLTWLSSLVLRSPFVDPKSPRKSNKVGQQNYEKHFSSRCYTNTKWGRQSRQIGTKNFLSYWPKNGSWKSTYKIKLEVSFDLSQKFSNSPW